MNNGWNCPSCGKAHAPHVNTCPEPQRLDVYGPSYPHPIRSYPYMPWVSHPVMGGTMSLADFPNIQSYN